MTDRLNRQRRIYETLAITDKALESLSDAILIADNDGVAVYINPAFSRIFGYNVNELNVGGIPNVLFRKTGIGEQIFNAVREDGTWKGEVELTLKAGHTAPFLLNIDRIRTNQGLPIGFITICTDVTPHRRINAIEEEQRISAEAQLETLRALTSTLDLEEVFSRILDSIRQVVPADAANIILIQDGKPHLVERDDYTNQEHIDKLKSGDYPLEAFKDLQTMMETQSPLIVPNTAAYFHLHGDDDIRTPWLNSHIGIPIKLQDTIIGFINVDSIQPNLFTVIHVKRLELFAEQAAIAIHNARLHEQAKQLAMLEERQRLARNLHDAVSQTLFSANLVAEALPKLWEKDPEEVLERLELIRQLNRGALAEMRSLLLELHPERLLETRLSKLFEQLVAGILGRTQINVSVNIIDNLTLPPELHIAIYYIAHEALNNVTKHANAKRVDIQLLLDESCLQLVITDDGVGFNPDQIASTSLGLNSIRERVQSTDADLLITSEIGKGTQILVSWSI